MKCFKRLSVGLLAAGFSLGHPALAHAQRGPAKTIKVILRVEAQGPQGQWTQLGRDLSTAQLDQPRSLIAKKIGGLANHRLVSPDDKDDDIGLAVVAEKLQSGRNTYVVISSALTIAKADKTDLLITHDVIAEASIPLAPHAVVGQLLGSELRALLR